MTQTIQRAGTYQISGAPAFSQTNLELRNIDPVRGAKYSPNLYAYLKRMAGKPWLHLQRVFVDEKGDKWLGYFDDVGHFTGSSMSRVLTVGGKAQTFTFVDLGGLREIEGFWDQYVADGRCALDREHSVLFMDNRWQVSEDGNSRSCMWCGKVRQHKHESVTTKVVHNTEWLNSSPTVS